MEEKIKKWKEEIEKVTRHQNEVNQKCNEKIRDLKKKIAEGEEWICKEQDRQVAQLVRQAYGKITPETLEELKLLMEIGGQKNGEDGS